MRNKSAFEIFLDKQMSSVISVAGGLAYSFYGICWVVSSKMTGRDLSFKPPFSLLAAFGTLVGLIFLWIAWRAQLLESDDIFEKEQQHRTLLKLKSGWLERVYEPSIHAGQPIAIPLKRAPKWVAPPGIDGLAWHSAPNDNAWPLRTSIVEAFEDSSQSLLICGEAGSGKTILLLQLAEDLYKHAIQDLSAPVPVVISLATWTNWLSLRSGSKGFEKWLLSQINKGYLTDKTVSKKWLSERKLVLLLDGLDEIEDERDRASCRNAIHASVLKWNIRVAVSCRASIMNEQNKLPLNQAVEVLPIKEWQVTDYVGHIGEAHLLSGSLRVDEEGKRLLTNPFMLWLALEAYSGMGALPVPLFGQFKTEGLLADFVKKSFNVIPVIDDQKPSDILRWICNLARCTRTGVTTLFSLVDLRETWLANGWARWTIRVAIVLTTFMFCALAETVVWFSYLIETKYVGPRMGHEILGQAFLAASVIGIPFGCAALLAPFRPLRFLPKESLSRGGISKSLRTGFLCLLSSTTLIVLVGFACRAWQHDIPVTNSIKDAAPLFFYHAVVWGIGQVLTPRVSLILGTCLGSLICLSSLFSGQPGSRPDGFARSTRYSLLTALSLGVVVGILLSFIPGSRVMEVTGFDKLDPKTGFDTPSPAEKRDGSLVRYVRLGGTPVGAGDVIDPPDIPVGGAILVFLSAGGLFAIRHYIVRSMMRATRNGPWKYWLFLENAEHYRFLRRVGGDYYMFRHPLLRDYFAGLQSPFRIRPHQDAITMTTLEIDRTAGQTESHSQQLETRSK